MKEEHKLIIVLTVVAIVMPMIAFRNPLLSLSIIADIFIFYYVYKLLNNLLHFLLYLLLFFISAFAFYYLIFHLYASIFLYFTLLHCFHASDLMQETPLTSKYHYYAMFICCLNNFFVSY